MKPALRKPVLTLHVWIGLIIGLPFLVVALSGAALIFRASLERRLDPHRFIVTPAGARLPLDQLVARAVAAHPQADLESIRFYGDPTMPVLVLFSDIKYVHLNPYTGAVLGVRSRYGEGYGWVEGLHKYLRLIPTLGENVNGTLAFIFAALFLTGFVLWWPATRRALQAGLTLNWRLKGRPWHLNLHKTLGAYTVLVLAFSALTGAPIAFPTARAPLYWMTGSRVSGPPVPPPGAAATGFAGFDAVERRIAAVMPDARETYIALPLQGLVVSYAIAADAPHPNARSYVWLTPDARVLRYTPYARAGAGLRLYYWLLSLHTAVAGGVVIKLLLLFSTLSVPLLAYTGVASYLRRKLGRPTTQNAPARAPGAASRPAPSARPSA